MDVYKQARLMCTNTSPLLLTPLSLFSVVCTRTHTHIVISGHFWVVGATMQGERSHLVAGGTVLHLCPPRSPLSSPLLLLRWERRQRLSLVTLQSLHLCFSFGSWRCGWMRRHLKGLRQPPSTSPSRPEVHCWPCQELLLLNDVCSLGKSAVLLHLMQEKAH